jgi:branched-chain amino acid transport system substrate-binding protein
MARGFLIVMALVVLGVGASSAAADTVRIGVHLPLSGQNAFGGQLELEGVRLAHEEAGAVLGRKVELFVVDNKSEEVAAANAVKHLIDTEHVQAIIGTYGSSLAMAGVEVAERAGVPQVGTSCTNPLVTQGKKHVFRVCFIDPFQGAGAATYAIKKLGMKKAAVLVNVANDYSMGLGNFFKRSFVNQGGEIVADLTYQSSDQDFTAHLMYAISKNPDVLFIPAYFTEGAVILKQAKALGATFKIMGGDAMDNPEVISIAGPAAEGFMHTTFPYDPSMADMNPVARKFTEDWRKKHPDQEPNVNAALGFDAYMLLLDAIQRAGSVEPGKISAALAETRGFLGVTGITTINETHDAEKPVGIAVIQEGKRVYLGSIQPEL